VWAVPTVTPNMMHLQSALSFDLMLMATLSFLMALLAAENFPRGTMLVGLAIGVTNVLIINATEFIAVPKYVVVALILLWQGDGFYLGYVLLPRRWVQRRRRILAICVVYGAAMVAYVLVTPGSDLNNWAIGEVLLCTAVLYRKWGHRPSVARFVGTAGFVGWAAVYFMSMVVSTPSRMEWLLTEFWNFPKYFVACTMILKVFEEASDEKVRLSGKFRELYEDFKLIYQSHPYPMWIADAAGGEFLSANEAALNVYGYNIEEFQGMRMEDLESQEDSGGGDVYAALEDPEEGKLIRHRHKDGRIRWVNVVDRELMYLGREARFTIAHDITEPLKLVQELSHRAQHDVLTGLPNRQLLADRLAQSLKSCEREQRRAAILTIDVDHFK
jgi:PAS domain S-box-containing protein